MDKQTKIVCTLGPASGEVDTIEKMVKAGMNVARLNFSHGTFETHKQLLDNVRAVEEKTGEPVAVLQDLQGPKIRVGDVGDGVELTDGSDVVFTTDQGNKDAITIGYEYLHEYVKSGEVMLFDDGKMQATIKSVDGQTITATVDVGGTLTSNKGINLPDSNLAAMNVLTDQDKEHVRFGVEQGVDMIALSFVMKPEDVVDLRYHIKEMEKDLNIETEEPIRIIAKIERGEAVERIEEIVDAADGIMVARGDLGVEIPAEEVPITQKKLIDVALEQAKPVIVATQMLDSMQNNPRPTRAEVSDVANAVIDHTDAVMLSNETATGKYPVETVTMMARIIRETEKSKYDNVVWHEPHDKFHKIDDTISSLSSVLATEVEARLILAASLSGETGRLISRYRPEFPIVVATQASRVQRQLSLSWGVHPFILVPCNTIEELVERSVLHLKKGNYVKPNDKIIVVAGEPVGHAGHVNLLEVREVE